MLSLQELRVRGVAGQCVVVLDSCTHLHLELYTCTLLYTVHVDKEMTTANLGYLGQDGSSVRKQVFGTRKHGQNMVKFSM